MTAAVARVRQGRPKTLLLMSVAVLCLGSLHLVEKLGIAAGAEPASFALGRTAAALLALAPVWLWRRQHEGLRLSGTGRLPALALIGVLASGVVVVLSLVALNYTSATHKGVVQAAYPLGTMLFAYLLLGERLQLRGYLAAAAIVVGLGLVARLGLAGEPNPGDWLLLATVPVMGFTDAYAKRVLGKVPPITVSLGRYLFGTLFLLALLGVLGVAEAATLLEYWPYVLGAGLLSALAMGFFYWGIKRAGPSLAAGLLATAPVVTAALEWGWLGQALAPVQLLGLGLVVLGAVVLAQARPD